MSQSQQSLILALRSEHYVQVRRRIFRQLVQGLIYEGLLLPVEQEGQFLIESDGATYTCTGKRTHTFGRIELTKEPLLRHAQAADADTAAAAVEAESLTQFMLDLQDQLGADPDRLAAFCRELEQTLLNDTLAQHHRHEQGLRFEGRPYDELESYVMDGHPYHPSYKSRMGFDAEDQYQYGPETRPDVRPIWLAVHTSETRLAASQRLDVAQFWNSELGAAQVARFHDTICAQGFDPADYHFVPAHPWQWQHRIQPAFHDKLRRGKLLLLGASEDVYHPQQSIRTLSNATAPGRAYLKLSMSIVNTSTGRVLAPHTVQNAPHVTDWLKGIAEHDPFLRDESRLILLGEVLGVTYNPEPLSDLVQSVTYGILGCIWRESLHAYLAPGEAAVPYNGLTALDLDGTPLITPWIEQYGITNWLTDLFQKTVLPVLHLLYAHGLALETHAQNMILVHDNGRPVRVALKDFHDGVRFSPAHVADPDAIPALLATPETHQRVNRNSFLETDDLIHVRDFMHDAFFFINLGELALLLDRHFGYEEAKFWMLLRGVIEAYQARFPELNERFQLFDLFAETSYVEQLTKRRLYPETEIRIQEVPNPLSLSFLNREEVKAHAATE
ncbi:siderophore synthetase component [Tumebacillus sp. BK434]|uniref:IucA/IucC family protein n=1 Tax=Tumebacillus sp. BK434 TaxID=2512169 RepID=UPI0010462807|nr:IucA/IucC family protein [Tumebacillus sp. BK434]TCP55761.1 siderophore synthetase component [Tumebacillus sp. BK434]